MYDENIRLDPYVEHVLMCPVCGGNNLHQESTEIFERSEDAETGLHVRATRDDVAVSTDISGNPSLRRQGMSIGFACEGGCSLILNIYQHKGCTYVSWISLDDG